MPWSSEDMSSWAFAQVFVRDYQMLVIRSKDWEQSIRPLPSEVGVAEFTASGKTRYISMTIVRKPRIRRLERFYIAAKQLIQCRFLSMRSAEPWVEVAAAL